MDSGASQSYIAPKIVALCEIECSPALVHLELADGSKVQSTQQTLTVPCTVGKAICNISFTVTKLLSNVDMVLGMDWLRAWNPVIDWRRQKLYIWVHGEWDHVNGVLLDAEQWIGTVKVFESYSGDVQNVPDISVVKKPQFWELPTDSKKKGKVDATKRMNCTMMANDIAKKKKEVNTVHQKERMTSKGNQQLISSKQMAKLMRRGELVYLAMIYPTMQSKQGITQKVKQQLMKEKGPIRKALPVAETRKRMCLDAPVEVRTEL